MIRINDERWIDPVYSSADGGWYCEVCNREGMAVGATGVHKTRAAAIMDARKQFRLATRDDYAALVHSLME